MRVLSLFSGVGGFDMGLEAAGMTTVFQCEIDKHARSVLDHHWPDVPKWDDVSTLTGQYILDHCDGVDVVAWGSPCQDLSLAGKRAGLSGERSGLFHQGIRIIKELRELSNGKSPTWSIWENVVGALSSNGGADFGEVLYEMDEAGACFSEWAVLDAQYFGVPQRRRRVFVISCFDPATSERCPEKILAVGESRSGNSAKGKSTGKGSAGTVTESIGTGRKIRTSIVGSDIVGPLAASDYKFPQQQQAHENKIVIQDVVHEISSRTE
jgi:DNA (cytosine-5)-methyltransferase 1